VSTELRRAFQVDARRQEAQHRPMPAESLCSTGAGRRGGRAAQGAEVRGQAHRHTPCRASLSTAVTRYHSDCLLCGRSWCRDRRPPTRTGPLSSVVEGEGEDGGTRRLLWCRASPSWWCCTSSAAREAGLQLAAAPCVQGSCYWRRRARKVGATCCPPWGVDFGGALVGRRAWSVRSMGCSGGGCGRQSL